MPKKEVNMLSGSIIKGLFVIALPIMIMNVVQSIFNIVDMTVLEMFGKDGDFAVGAVGTCGSLITLATGLLIGMAAGVNVVIAKHVAVGDREKAEEATGTAILFAFIGGLTLMVIGVLFAENFLVLMNCPAELLSQATLYLRMYSVGVPILMVYNFSAAILRSVGDTKRPMIFLLSGGVIKLIFNFLFVAVFDMSVAGVALATIISWSVSAFCCVYVLIKNDSIVKFKLNHCRFYAAELKEILFIGVPAGVQQALYSFANVIINSAVNSFGAQAATGIAIANNFDGILYYISTAAALAVMPYVTQNIAVGNTKRANSAVRDGIIISVILGATFGFLSAAFSGPLSSIMSKDPAVIAFSQQKMMIISSTYFICGINEIMCSALRGMRISIIPTISVLIYMCAFRFVWVYLIFPHFRNLTFLYLVWPIGWILSICTLLPFYIFNLKKLSKENTHIENIV